MTEPRPRIKLRHKLRAELETPREQHALGSGWLSGTLAFLLGAGCLVLAVCRAFPGLFITPRFHHWHHGEERAVIDVIFATHFPLFDRLSGTHHMPQGRWPKAYGIEGHPVPQGYWQQFLYPFRR